ncbi:MAG: sulfatase-like hydrolase/transferase [Actinobacteria bacterium]|nr:sulfatase-like hydrolase/transferase [Actinomycetota bacterium]
MRPNVLLITLDQYRGDSLSCAGHPLVRTPHLDAFAQEGVRFSRHYAQAAPCAPGRAALYTGTYQMNNRVVANGTPLAHSLDNVARLGLRAGYHPVMFGYTDQGADIRRISDPDDPRLRNWEGVLPGFDELLCLDERHGPWMEWLQSLGYDVHDPEVALATEHERPAEHSVTQFLTDHFLTWLGEQDGPWFAHTSYIRPHPPYDAAGHYSTMYAPEDCPLPLPIPDDIHPSHAVFLGVPQAAAPTDANEVAQLRSQYYGMISEVDHHMGRIWRALRDRGEWENTVVIITADHGEQLCDQGLVQKLGWFESSYHIVGMIRDPRHPAGFGTVVDDFTENVDIMPTLCEAIGAPVPLQCDGLPLTPVLRGERPAEWRREAHYEWDWRDVFIQRDDHPWPWDRRLERQNLAVVRDQRYAYVQFGDGDWLCYDLAADPTWQTKVDDPAVVLPLAQKMLVWRQQHLDRQLTGTLIKKSGLTGRIPDPHAN